MKAPYIRVMRRNRNTNAVEEIYEFPWPFTEGGNVSGGGKAALASMAFFYSLGGKVEVRFSSDREEGIGCIEADDEEVQTALNNYYKHKG